MEFPQRLVVEVDEKFGLRAGETKGALHERLRNGQQPVGDPTHRGNHDGEPRLPTRVAHQCRGMQDPVRPSERTAAEFVDKQRKLPGEHTRQLGLGSHCPALRV